MDELKPIAKGAIAVDENWEIALQEVLAQLEQSAPAGSMGVDLALLFISSEYVEHYTRIVRRVRAETGARILIGCSGQGIVGTGQEMEDVPSLSLLTLSLPGAQLKAVRFSQEIVEENEAPEEWHRSLGVAKEDVNAWLIFADPFQLDCEGLIDGLAKAYPDLPMLGGLASYDQTVRRTYIFVNDDVFDEGGVGLAIGGAYSMLPLVSQGCKPIGEPWTITHVRDDGLIEKISNRPAYELLVDTFQGLPEDMQRRAQSNLLVGLAADEYVDTFRRGNFLIRNLSGVDRRIGAIAIAAYPRVGQTIQFQMRDAKSADLDLRELLGQARADLGNKQPVAGILCTCNGRGEGMFAMRDHDAGLIEKELGPIPLAGLFCNGEIGPIGKRPFLHGFTASLALLVKRDDRS
jgi:small ligand-binding sensory domain FIST